MVRIYSDGFFNSHTYGFSVVSEHKEVLMLFELPVINRITDTVNTAEYLGVINAMNIAEKGTIIYSDSMLVVNQVNNKWRINMPHLQKLKDLARKLLEEKSLTLNWISRNYNLAGLYNEGNKTEFKLSFMDIDPIIVTFTIEESSEPVKKVTLATTYKKLNPKYNSRKQKKNKKQGNVQPFTGKDQIKENKTEEVKNKDKIITLLMRSLKEIDNDKNMVKNTIKDCIILLLEK